MSKHEPSHLDENRLHEFLDGALETDKRQEVEAHIAECSSCSARLRELRALFDVLESLPDEVLSRDLVLPVLAGVQQTNSISVRSKFYLALQFVALGVTLAFVWTNVRAIAERILLSPIGIDVVAVVHEFKILLPEIGSDLMAILRSFLTSSRLLIRPSITSTLQIDAGSVLLVIFLAWVVANGLLLRSSALRLRVRR
ncbi:MAG: hypothetical protein GTO14_11995 [Anaerolineales bacterium]|nr:hypothetical protein [Anaerolineales bacterium]